jgi:hypothetical protein
MAHGVAVGPPALGRNKNPGWAYGTGSGAGIRAALQGSFCRKMSKLLVRRGEISKGMFVSSKITCQKTMMLLAERLRY